MNSVVQKEEIKKKYFDKKNSIRYCLQKDICRNERRNISCFSPMFFLHIIVNT
jgi:hypothetical protein